MTMPELSRSPGAMEEQQPLGRNLKIAAMLEGAKLTFPVILGAIPFGVIFGTLADQAGLSFWAIMGLSVFVYGGASQIVAIGLITAGASVPVIILTTFVVNLRHILYAAALVERFKNLSHRWRIALAFFLTDETYATVNDQLMKRSDDWAKRELPYFQLGSSLAMYSNWSLCTFLGLTLGQLFPDIASWGLDFAMVATFTAMIPPYLTRKPSSPVWACIITSGVIAIVALDFPNKLGLMIAAISGIAVGFTLLNIRQRMDGSLHQRQQSRKEES